MIPTNEISFIFGKKVHENTDDVECRIGRVGRCPFAVFPLGVVNFQNVLVDEGLGNLKFVIHEAVFNICEVVKFRGRQTR